MADVCRDEAGFGPAASCRNMDFSLGFQYRILAILPAAVFLFLGITRLTDLWRRHSITKSKLDALACVKIFLCAVLITSLASTLALLPRDGWGDWASTAYGVELSASVRPIVCFMCFILTVVLDCPRPALLHAPYASART